MLRSPHRKRWLRRWYSLYSGQPWEKVKRGQFSDDNLLSAGKSVAGITQVETVEAIVSRFVARARAEGLL
jgi:hypothetical protein